MITEGEKKKRNSKDRMCQQDRGPLMWSTRGRDLERGAQHWAPHYHRQIGVARDGWEHDEGATRTGLRRKIKRLKHVQAGQVTGQPRSPRSGGKGALPREPEGLCCGEMGWDGAEGKPQELLGLAVKEQWALEQPPRKGFRKYFVGDV